MRTTVDHTPAGGALLFGLLVSVPLAGAPAAARQDEQLQIVFSVPDSISPSSCTW